MTKCVKSMILTHFRRLMCLCSGHVRQSECSLNVLSLLSHWCTSSRQKYQTYTSYLIDIKWSIFSLKNWIKDVKSCVSNMMVCNSTKSPLKSASSLVKSANFLFKSVNFLFNSKNFLFKSVNSLLQVHQLSF